MKVFAAYPDSPEVIGSTIETAFINLKGKGHNEYNTWKNGVKYGETIDRHVLDHINTSKEVYFDITVPNFNVIFEAAYAIAAHKNVGALVNSSIIDGAKYVNQLGIFDVIQQIRFTNSDELTAKIHEGIFVNTMKHQTI